jgi:zinc finger-like protein
MRATVSNEKGKRGFREGLVNDIQQACVAMRVSMETHVAKEEAELWPLFEKHFSFEEQEKIVGQIIGRTGAEVLRSMLIWVRDALNEDEREGMISSMRHATQNTHFAQWMNTWYSGKCEEIETGDDWVKAENGKSDVNPAAETEKRVDTAQDGMRQVHAYLRDRAGDVDKETFKPGWEDIFRMNQIQLEEAVRTVNRDDTLAPTKKAYLIQNLMASRWIVGNQLQAQRDKTTTLSSVEGEKTAPAAICPPVTTEFNANGCKHYKRRCRIIAPCCGQTFACRFCHDDASDHTVNRTAISEMVCNVCDTRQPVSNECTKCGAEMASYYCNVCHLFDGSGNDIYHCPFCNVCRRGKGLGIDFFHCMKCNACVSLQHGKHECSERGMDSECPVCKEFLADSETPVKELPCGHLMHAGCFATYTRHYYTCPLCRKSLGDFSVYFRMLDAILADENDDSVPDALRGKTQKVSCNDCGKESDAKFHFVYHACAHCRSYNTSVLTY